MLNYSEIKDWEAKAVNAKLTELRKELFNYRMQQGTSGLQKSHLVKSVKADIARLKTAMSAAKKSEK